jgi:hypothetical protein
VDLVFGTLKLSLVLVSFCYTGVFIKSILASLMQ